VSSHDFRIALIDGDPAIRAGRRLLLDSQPDMKVVYEQAQALVALDEIENQLIDVLIINHRLQGTDGVTLAKRLVERLNELEQVVPAVIITGSYFTFELLMASIRAGATELITQDSPSSELLDAVRKSRRAMADVKLAPFKAFLESREYTPEPDVNFLLKLTSLSVEERALVDLLAEARDISEISAMLGVSTSRIREMVERVIRAFGCATIEQLFLLTRDSRHHG
jgi:DNA-binding NarL/FixJ family response regulator